MNDTVYFNSWKNNLTKLRPDSSNYFSHQKCFYSNFTICSHSEDAIMRNKSKNNFLIEKQIYILCLKKSGIRAWDKWKNETFKMFQSLHLWANLFDYMKSIVFFVHRSWRSDVWFMFKEYFLQNRTCIFELFYFEWKK